MSEFLNRAIELAIENVDNGGTPYGAVIVKDNKIIGEGVNTMHIDPDISGHAEMIAIRQAQELLGRVDLSDCIVYASGHPCPMCFGAITLSSIPEVFYMNTPEEAAEAGMPLTAAIYKYLKGEHGAIGFSMKRQEAHDDEQDPMKYWVEKNKQE